MAISKLELFDNITKVLDNHGVDAEEQAAIAHALVDSIESQFEDEDLVFEDDIEPEDEATPEEDDIDDALFGVPEEDGEEDEDTSW